MPADGGIAADGAFWIYYDGSYTNARLAWLDANSRLLANIEATPRRKQLIALDSNHMAYACTTDGRSVCIGLDRQRSQQRWESCCRPALIPGGRAATRSIAGNNTGWVSV